MTNTSIAKPILYGFTRSSATRRVRLALDWKGVDYDTVLVDLTKKEQQGETYRAINPNGKVPSLATEEGNIITQSIAILEYIEERYPGPLLPSDPLQRAKVRMVMNLIATDIQPPQSLAMKREGKLWVAGATIASEFEALENHLQTMAGKYCVGDQVTLADFCLLPQYKNGLLFEVDMSPYPTITRICETLLAMPQVAKSDPANAFSAASVK